MKYRLTVFTSDYVKAGDNYQRTESKTYYTLDADGVQNLIGLMVEGSEKDVKFEIRKLEEEEA